MKKTDKKVKEYLERARDLARKLEMVYQQDTVKTSQVIEIAKMIQREETK